MARAKNRTISSAMPTTQSSFVRTLRNSFRRRKKPDVSKNEKQYSTSCQLKRMWFQLNGKVSDCPEKSNCKTIIFSFFLSTPLLFYTANPGPVLDKFMKISPCPISGFCMTGSRFYPITLSILGRKFLDKRLS